MISSFSLFLHFITWSEFERTQGELVFMAKTIIIIA